MPHESNDPPPASAAVGMKDLARRLGVSTGTVDRALNDKPGISPVTRARVLAAAGTLDYTPNLAARYLRSRKQLRIAVQLPNRVTVFWEALREGIREAAAPFAPALHVEFRPWARAGGGEIPLMQRAIADGIDGMIISPGDPVALAPHITEAARRRIPVVCVVTDVPDSPRLLSVSADACTAGAVAAELLGRCLSGGSQIGCITGWKTPEHSETLRGVASSLSALRANLAVGPILETPDDEREVYLRTRDMLRAHPQLRGLYIGTNNSLPALRAAEQEGRLGGLTVVATDLLPELVDWIRAGKVVATIDQRPLTQGRIAFQSLCRFLQNPHRLVSNHRVVPYLVMSSNLDVVLDGYRAGNTGHAHPPSAQSCRSLGGPPSGGLSPQFTPPGNPELIRQSSSHGR